LLKIDSIKFIKMTNLVLRNFISFCLIPLSFSCSGQVSGLVFRDFNGDGVKATTTSTSLEPGVGGITVVAYPSSGAIQTSTTNATGNYSFSGLTLPVRIEFSNLPNGNYTGPQGIESNTTVQFYSSATTMANLGINNPAHYSQSNPDLITPKHLTGDPFAGGSNMSGDPALYKFPNTASGDAQSGGTPLITLATQAQIGSTWGAAYDRVRKKYFTSSVYRRHAPLGPGETGGRIFVIDDANSGSPGSPIKFIDLVSDLGISVGTIQTNAARGLPNNKSVASQDDNTFSAAGKVGLGDLDISDDGKFLFIVNLFDKKVYKIDIAQVIAGTPNAAPLPDFTLPCSNGNSRPWGLGMWDGELYLGVVCDATSGSIGDLRMTVQKFNFASSSWTEVLNVTPDWEKGDAIFGAAKHKWQKWEDIWNNFISSNWPVHPQPLIGDIEFDEEGSMHLAVLDRTGFQAGHRQLKSPSDGGLYTCVTAGELLRTYKDPTTGVFSLESNGSSGPYTTGGTGDNSQTGQGGPNTLQGPGGGEFYCDDHTTTAHSETTSGGLSLVKGSRSIASVQMDPIDGQVDAQGITWFNTTNGLESQEYQIFYNAGGPSPDFSKQNGLGDLEYMSDPARIEIGNRIWTDTNSDGIQDAGEAGIDGVTVKLFEGTTEVASTTTSNGGQYYFRDSNVTGGLKYNTAYEIRIETAQGPISTMLLSTTDAGFSDLIDNDGTTAGANVVKSFTTDGPGANNHSYDFGFKTPPSCVVPSGVLTQTAPTCTGATPNNDGKITLTAVTNADKYGVSTGATYTGPNYASASSIALPQDVQTAIPNTGGTYTIRLFNGDNACYKDTIVTVTNVFCFTQPPFACGMRIDSLSAFQNSNTNGRISSIQSNSVLLGGERDMHFITNVPVSQTSTLFEVGPYFSGGTALDIANQAAAASTLAVQWDGLDNDPITLNPVGLGGLNFVALNIDRIRAEMSADFPNITNDSLPITFELYSNAGAASKIVKNFKFPNNALNFIEFNFSELVPFAGTGVDLSNIGAVVMKIDMQPNAVSTRTGWDVFLRDITLECTVCTKPTGISLASTVATCTGSTPNNNGKITLTSATNADKYGISSGVTYTGAPYASATSLPALPLDVQSMIPNSGATYTLRLFNGSDNCYRDTTIRILGSNCSTACGTMTVTAVPTVCTPSTNLYDVNGEVSFTSSPVSGTLTISNSGGGSVTFNAPFTSPTAYAIPNLVSNGATNTITAVFSEDRTFCTESIDYTAPASCNSLPCPPKVCLLIGVTKN
jgi:hypothetical protein